MVSEADWELIALECLAEHSWEPQPGQAIAPGTEAAGLLGRSRAARSAARGDAAAQPATCRPTTWSRR